MRTRTGRTRTGRMRTGMGSAVLAVLAAGLLVVGLSAAPAGAQTGGGAPRAAPCARLDRRIARIPALQQRIQDRIDVLQARLDAVRDPTRRARVAAVVQPRIDRLRQLSEQLSRQVAAAQRLCANRTT